MGMKTIVFIPTLYHISMKKLMRKIIPIIAMTVLLFSCNENKKESNTIDIKEISQAEIEQEVWKAIEGRFKSWKDNDFETYMAYHHPDWKKWESKKK